MTMTTTAVRVGDPGGALRTSGSGVRARSADVHLARHSFGRIWKGAAICALVFGGTAASSAWSYATTFPDAVSRAQVAALTSGDRGLTLLLGPTASTGTVGGYTVYKGFAFLTTIGAIWAVLATTRLLRGEEDAGRWQLVLAGGTRPERATAATILAVLAGAAVIFAGTFVIVGGAGQASELELGLVGSAVYAASLALVPVVFVSVGAVASQLGRTRRAASTIAIVAVGSAYVVRMVADSGEGLRWLRWATPFGWSELIQPFAENDLRPIGVAALATSGIAVAAVALAARRDVGAGFVASRDVAALRPFGLRSMFTFGVRMEGPAILAWWIGAAVLSFIMGLLATMTTASVPESMDTMLERFGATGPFIDQYFGVVFLLVAAVVALMPASQIAAIADEELSGRLVHIDASPIARTRWFADRVALASFGVVVAGAVAGLAAWAGARSQGVDVDPVDLLVAGVNVVPAALLVLGLAAVMVAVWPRAASTVAYLIVAWSLIVDLISSMVPGLSWMGPLSIFASMALAPVEAIELRTTAATVVVALALVVIATVRFGRRDAAVP